MPPRPQVTFAIGDIPAVVLAVTGGIRSIRFPVQGQVSDLACVEASNGSFALKRIRTRIEFLEPCDGCLEPNLEWAAAEYRVLAHAASNGLPVARPHAHVRLGTPPDEETWLVMDALPGEPLVSPEDTPLPPSAGI